MTRRAKKDEGSNGPLKSEIRSDHWSADNVIAMGREKVESKEIDLKINYKMRDQLPDGVRPKIEEQYRQRDEEEVKEPPKRKS